MEMEKTTGSKWYMNFQQSLQENIDMTSTSTQAISRPDAKGAAFLPEPGSSWVDWFDVAGCHWVLGDRILGHFWTFRYFTFGYFSDTSHPKMLSQGFNLPCSESAQLGQEAAWPGTGNTEESTAPQIAEAPSKLKSAKTHISSEVGKMTFFKICC